MALISMKPKKETKKEKKGYSRQFVVLVGDEGAVLTQIESKKVVKRLYASSPNVEHTRGFDELLSLNPTTPITFLIDMMDQSYVRQTLPPVSRFNVGKIIRRRLDKDFSPDDIKGFIILGREKTGRRDWNYLMVALGNSPGMQKWLEFLLERPNPFKAMGTVPIEAQSLILAIQKVLIKQKTVGMPKDKAAEIKPLEWQMLVSHQKVGGFRQVVLQNNQIIFTRMAQSVGDSSPDVIAGNIEQELINTMEYLKRLGLQNHAALSVTIITSEDIKATIDPKNIKCEECLIYTPYELSELLGLTNAAEQGDHFGDVAISAFVGLQKKLRLPLYTPYIRKLSKYVFGIKASRSLAALLATATLIFSGYTVYDIVDTQGSIEQVTEDATKLVADTEKLKIKAKAAPKDIILFSDAVQMIKAYYKRRYDPLYTIDKLSTVMQNTAIVKELHWTLSDPLNASKDNDKRSIVTNIDFHLINSVDTPEKFASVAQPYIDRIQQSFPDTVITHSEFPGAISEEKQLETIINDSGTKDPNAEKNPIPESFTVTITRNPSKIK